MINFQLPWSDHGHTSESSVNRKHCNGSIGQFKKIRQGALGSLFVTLFWAMTAPVFAAEYLTLRLGPFEQSVAIKELEKFAETGELSPVLQPYRDILTPQIRKILTNSLKLNPKTTETFINDLLLSSDGARLLDRLGLALPDSSLEQLKAALLLGARQVNGLSVLSFLRAYPGEKITLDASSAVGIALQLNASYWKSLAVGPILEQDLAVADAATFRPKFDPATPGPQLVKQRKLRLRDRQRQRTIIVDLYWAEETTGPLVVLSHGFAADRKFLRYLARHLASHGLTVASLEHPGSNFTRINSLSAPGKLGDLLPPGEFVDRPKDVSFLLDELADINGRYSTMLGKLNTQQVTIIGHSLGGYTALALAGGKLDLEELRRFCKNRSPVGRSPADWFQCAAADLPEDQVNLRDQRVVQAIALNSVTGRLFGTKGLRHVTLPTLMLTGTEDAITPALDHQLRSFNQLGGSKYLISAIGGTHLSVTDPKNLNDAIARSTLVKEVVGDDAYSLRQLVKGVSLAFIKQLTPEAQPYEPFLTPAYAQSLSTPKISLRLSTKLPATMATWFQVLSVGNQQVAINFKDVNYGSISSNKFYFYPNTKMMNSNSFCIGELNQLFTKLINKYREKASRIS